MRTRWILVLLTVVSFFFRFWYFSTHIVVSNDTVRDAQIVEQHVKDGTFLPTLGPKASVANFFLPPLYYQVHLIFSVFTNHHVLTMNFVNTFVEALTPIVLFLILRKVVSAPYAVGLSLLYVVSPLPTIFGTRAWNPITIPFFSTLALWLFLEYLDTKKKLYIVLLTLSITISIQLHYQAVVLLPFYVGCLFWTFYARKDDVKYWFIGGFLSLLLLLPYFFGEVASGWLNTVEISNYFTGEHTRYFDRVSKPEYVFSFIPAFFERILLNTMTHNYWLGRSILLVGLVSFVFLARSIKRKKPTVNRILILLLVYVVSIIIALRLYKGDKIDYYMSTLFTAPFFLLALCKKLHSTVAYFTLFFLLFFSFKATVSIPQFNDLSELQRVTELLKRMESSDGFRYFFHDIRQANTFSYLIYKNPELKINQMSNTLVEVFAPNSIFDFNTTNCSTTSLEADASNTSAFTAFKCSYSYTTLGPPLVLKDFSVQVGSVKNAESVMVNHHVDSSHGTDILLKELF